MNDVLTCEVNAVQNFLDYLKHEKRYSYHTIVSYENDLVQFSNFLSDSYEITDFNAVSHQHIRTWIISLSENNISPRTINRKISTLKTFFKFLLKREKISANPTLKVIAPKTSKKLPEYVEEREMNWLLEKINFGEGFEAMRDKLIIELLYHTGIRLSELINLKMTDVDTRNNTIKVIGKGNKERLIPVSADVIDQLATYYTEKEKLFANQFLFITAKGTQIYHKLVYRVVKKYLGMVTTMSKKSPHVLRHTFATHLANKGADINAIKELLGHANLSATQIYTHNNIEQLKDVYKTAHPKS